MRMLVKYTASVDLNSDGTEKERGYYLSFVKSDDVMDIPFETFEEMSKKASEYTIGEYVNSDEFIEKVSVYDDYKEFFSDIDTLVLYDKAVGVKFSFE